MADAKTEKQKVQEITEKLEQGLKELFESEKYRTYLNTMSKFHNYSINNTILIAMQKPDATLVAGYKAWQKNFERHVKKGEKGIRILAPAPYKIKEEQEKIDPVTNEPMLDKDGMPIMEEVEIKIPAFRVVPVFDVSQTDGKELPELSVDELSAEVDGYQDFMRALEAVSPAPIGYEDIPGEAKGYFDITLNRIAIQEGMSESQTVKTAIHEVAHAKLHSREREKETDLSEHKDRNTKEVEAESVAYTVCQHFGIDTSDYSFGYIAGWSSGKEMTELKSSLDTIRRTASELISGIEAQLQELQRERVTEAEQTQDIVLLVANTDRSEYDLLNVRGMSGEELVTFLAAMNDDDRLSVEAYLESKGGWVTPLANEQTEEVEEYHLDYVYNTDTYEITDVKARMMEQKSLEPIAETDVIVRIQGAMGSDFEIDRITNMSLSEVKGILLDMASLDENEWDGNAQKYLQEHGAELAPIMASDGLNEAYAAFFDLEYDFDKNDVTAITELSVMQQAENLIHRLEFGAEAFSDEERNLIVNHAYKLGDMEKTKELAEHIAMYEENSPNLVAQTVINAQAEIDALPDSMVGISEMHEYGYTWAEMLPLTQERALELFNHDLPVYRLYEDGSEATIEDRAEVMEHSGMFGIEKDDWAQYVELQTMRDELEESSANREAQLLYGRDNQFGIYQLNDSPQARDIHFMNSDFLEMKGIAITRENYDLVYTAPLEEGTSLEDIFTQFNIDRPEDFRGHSLSVSDVVVLHQNGENTCHFVDSFGYKEVPEFIQEVAKEREAEQTSVIDETMEVLGEIAKEHAGEEPERENAVFLVNYNEWRDVGELDLGQNYFAIDDPYGDGDYRLLWLQNQIKDITPAGVQYDTYEEAAQALYEVEREVANLPHNKENNIGSYMVNGKAQLERIMEERALQKHMDMENDKVSYYVIADLSTWADNSPERSELERFDSFEEALEKFKAYREKDAQFSDTEDKARTTLGFNVHGIEFDVIHARNNENVLSLDFTHSSEATQSNRFMDDLQILCNELVDKVRLHRDMSPEEVKDFVKQRFEHHLHSTGIEDASMYMDRFDTLYEQGKMEHLMPTASQRHIIEHIPLVEWENEYVSINNRFADIADKELSVVEYEMLLGMEPAQVSVDGLMEMMNSNAELWNYPMDEKDHCLQENIPVVTVRDGEEARYFEIPEELVARVRKSEFRGYEPEQMAFAIGDKFVSIQFCEGGYDYSIFNSDYSLVDGGVYDNPDISIHAALKDILEDSGVKATDERIPVDYEELIEKGEAVEQAAVEARRTVADFKAKTKEMFNDIEGQSAEEVEQAIYAHIMAKLEEYDIPVEIMEVVVSGSRCRGLEQEGSDLDVVVEYKGRENEDDLFNAFNEDGLTIGGVKVDINPITEGKTGTLATYLPGVESYLAEKREAMQKEAVTEAEQKETVVTLTVAECGEFHNLGEFHEGIETVDEAIKLFAQIPPDRMNGIPSIGINIHTEGTERFEDVEMDIVSGKVADLEMLEYVPDISDNPKAVEVIGELIDKLPDIEVRGSLDKFQIAILAAQIDQLSYDYDTYQYRDTVEDRDAQIATIAEDIRSGNTEYLRDFLNAIVSDGIREGVVDMFGKGMDTDNSEAIQTVRKAQELLDKLSAYKPLAKVEELEEGNYNMVDNVLNNGVEKKEQERASGRISIREKLAEKKAAIEHKDKAQQKDQDKKAQREM